MLRSLLPVTAALTLTANAAILLPAGSLDGLAGTNNDEIDQWRSTNELKTFDIDGDNVYGTDGYVLFATDVVGNTSGGTAPQNVDPFTFVNGLKKTILSVPSYLSFTVVTATSTGVASGYGYRVMDDPTLTPGTSVSDIQSGSILRGTAIGTEAAFFDITVGEAFPMEGIRIGFIFRNTDAYDGAFRLEQTVGGSGSLSFTQSSANSPDLQMAFFDITGAVQGDTFRFYGVKNIDSGGNQNANVLLGGVSIDVIPEPTAALLTGVGLLGLLTRRRRG